MNRSYNVTLRIDQEFDKSERFERIVKRTDREKEAHHEAGEDSFTPKQVAQALQVSESSVKRWCDRGDIRTDRTLGGHRRIPRAFLIEFLEATKRRVLFPDALGGSVLPRSVNFIGMSESAREAFPCDDSIRAHLVHSLLTGNETECRRAVCAWYKRHPSVAALGDELLCPTLRAIGEAWRCGEAEVYQERQGCDICARLIHDVRGTISEPSPKAMLAMGGTCEGDHYQLSNQLIELVFRQAGWRTCNVGTNVPFSSLLAAALKHRPRIFWISVSHIEDEKQFLEQFQVLANGLPVSTMLLVGGRALSDTLRPKMRFSAFCDSLAQLDMLAKSMRAS